MNESEIAPPTRPALVDLAAESAWDPMKSGVVAVFPVLTGVGDRFCFGGAIVLCKIEGIR